MRGGWLRDLGSVGVVVGLMLAVYLLPPDTSLREVRQAGVLRVCAPPDYPPLIQRGNAEPGFEIELLRLIADRMGLRLAIATNSAMARDHNPRNWRISRAQCNLIAGGIGVTPLTRTFLDTTPPHLETGWAMVRMNPDSNAPPPQVIGFYAGLSGMDRVALSRVLLRTGAQIVIVDSLAALQAGMASGRFDAAVTEALIAGHLVQATGGQIGWVTGSVTDIPVAFGLWKGDLTLKRAIVAVLEDLRAAGTLDQLAQRYRIVPIPDRAPGAATGPDA